ncbi:MAG: DUF554 domain-containing protein, partial [Treponemataceae bacterium]|nr:DUF554 domain-containing protein [Treponemataceae bacterium]
MLAVFVNCFTVILGGLLGCLLTKKITPSFSEIVQTGAGVVTLVMGLQMAFSYNSIICLVLCLILGGLLGEWIDIDGAILKLGERIERLVPSKKKADDAADQKNFAFAFLNASVLFCVGAMAILGSFKAGIDHDYTITFTKSILDGFMAIVFAGTMGIGSIFSAISIFVYQGALTILGQFIAPYVSELMLTELTACGGAMIVMIGLNLLNLKKIKTANYLPGLILVVVYVLAG